MSFCLLMYNLSSISIWNLQSSQDTVAAIALSSTHCTSVHFSLHIGVTLSHVSSSQLWRHCGVASSIHASCPATWWLHGTVLQPSPRARCSHWLKGGTNDLERLQNCLAKLQKGSFASKQNHFFWQLCNLQPYLCRLYVTFSLSLFFNPNDSSRDSQMGRIPLKKKPLCLWRSIM